MTMSDEQRCPFCNVLTFTVAHVCKSNIRRYRDARDVRSLVQMSHEIDGMKQAHQRIFDGDEDKRAG